MTRQRLDVHDDVRQLGQSIVFEPLDNLLARPLMIVVQMEDNCIERQPFLAPDRTSAPHVFKAIEQTMQAGSNRMRFMWIARQRVSALVRGAKRTGPARVGEVLTEGLTRSALRTFRNRLGELDLIGAWDLMHDVS